MEKVERIAGKISGGKIFVEQMKEFGLEETLAEWQLGLLKLESVWNIARSIKEVPEIELLARIIYLFRARHEIFIKFAQMCQNDEVSFEEALIQVCKTISDLKLLALGLTEFELGESTACLAPCEKDGFVELSLRMKGLSPSQFLTELAEDLGQIRRSQDEELSQKNIIAYSWLLDMSKKKTERVLNWLGIGPANGARILTVDPNNIESLAYPRVGAAAVMAIPLSDVNIDRYLRHGKLPRVGILEISARDFWG